MIFDDTDSFDTIIDKLKQLEDEIRRLNSHNPPSLTESTL